MGMKLDERKRRKGLSFFHLGFLLRHLSVLVGMCGFSLVVNKNYLCVHLESLKIIVNASREALTLKSGDQWGTCRQF